MGRLLMKAHLWLKVGWEETLGELQLVEGQADEHSGLTDMLKGVELKLLMDERKMALLADMTEKQTDRQGVMFCICLDVACYGMVYLEQVLHIQSAVLVVSSFDRYI